MKKTTRSLLIIAGTLCVALAALGVLLPVLPTTPFLLLAAFCYGHSSDRFYQLLISNWIFGRYLQNYREGRGIPMRQKITTILLLWASIGSSIYFLAAPMWATLLLLAIASGVSVFLISVKTYQGERELTGETL
jgi:uncharacterized protein